MSEPAERLAELAADLERIADGLADAAMEVLRGALSADTGDEEELAAAAKEATATEKVVLRARTAALKAARLARQAAGAPEEDDAADRW